MRHLKFLRRNLTVSQLKKLWSLILPGVDAPQFIKSEIQETQTKISLGPNVTSHIYSKIYLKSLTLSWMLYNQHESSTVT